MLVVLALVGAIGGHWAVLQSVAWVGMTFRYVQTDSIGVALRKTFDGQHPCRLCKAVEAGKKSEDKQVFLKVETKIDFWLSGSVPLLDPPVIPSVWPTAVSSPPLRLESPPTPPPRAA